jgi:hypothetical protein
MTHSTMLRAVALLAAFILMGCAAALLAVFVFIAWAFYATRRLGVWTGETGSITLTIAAAILVTGAAAGALIWLTLLYASRNDSPEDGDQVG